MFIELVKEWKGKPVGERIDVPEEYVQILIDSGTARKCDDPTNGLVSKAMEQAAGKLTESLDGIIALAMKQFATAQTKSRKNGVPEIFGDNGEGDAKHCFGDWLLHAYKQDQAYLEKEYGSSFSPWQKAALATASASRSVC